MSLTRQAKICAAALIPRNDQQIGVGRTQRRLSLNGLILVALCASCLLPITAQSTQTSTAYIAIIIDDLGNNKTLSLRATKLPGPVACAILPHTRFSRLIAETAHTHNKEVLLHLPMEPEEHKEAGPGKLESGMRPREIRLTLSYNLESVPYVVGINNHMGSLLTQQTIPMHQLMQIMQDKFNYLFFIDSLTTAHSVVPAAAGKYNIPYLVRDVFLDHQRSPKAIEKQLQRLIRQAKRNGSALGIGHPYHETLAVLEERLPTLSERGVELISPTKLLSITMNRKKTWQQSLSH